jgi:D-citramalate synthase
MNSDLELTQEQTKAVTQRITQLGDRKELVTQEDFPYIVSDVLKHSIPDENVKVGKLHGFNVLWHATYSKS